MRPRSIPDPFNTHITTSQTRPPKTQINSRTTKGESILHVPAHKLSEWHNFHHQYSPRTTVHVRVIYLCSWSKEFILKGLCAHLCARWDVMRKTKYTTLRPRTEPSLHPQTNTSQLYHTVRRPRSIPDQLRSRPSSRPGPSRPHPD